MIKKNWLKILIFAFLIWAVVWAGKGIFKYNIFSTHDGDHHIARSFDVVKTFSEGQFPLRWAGSLNYFCGVPIYNFFYPFIYYLVVLIYFFTKNIIFSLKIIDFASLLFGTLFFYLWIKVETKKELAAIGGALTYLYAPYRFSLIFVRGSPEFLAYAVLPIVLYFYALVFDSSGKKFILYAFLASLMGAVLTISHNFTVMFLMPVILAYLVIKIYVHKLDLKRIGWVIFSFIGAFGMGSFFIGPALLEQKFTRIGKGFLEWRDHFPTFGQLLRSKWGYFYSSSGTINDGMSFMLGYAQWLILGIAGLFIVYQVFKYKFNILKIIRENLWIIFFFAVSIFAIYLILPVSIPLWEKIRPLQEIQFSWRLLGVAVFTISSLFSFLLARINSKFVYVAIFVGVSFLTIFGTRHFMLPQPISVEDLYKYDDFEKLHYHRYSTTTLADDAIASTASAACWFDVPLIATDKEEIKYSVERGNTYGFVKFSFPKNAKGKTITTGLGYFPEIYKFEINGRKVPYNDCEGRVCFDTSVVRPGQNYLSWKIGQTKVEKTFNYTTLGFLFVWLMLIFLNLTGIDKGKKKTSYFILSVILFLAFLFFRTYNLPGRMGFGWDQERDAKMATEILSGNLTLLGPRVQGPSGFFLPPYFFYLIAPFYKTANLSPYTTTHFIIFWAVLTFTLGYLILSKIFDKKITLFFLAIWAVNPLAVSIDTIAWNPVVIPVLFLILIYSVYLALKKQDIKSLFLAGLVFGLGVSFHLQFLFIFLLLIPLVSEILKSKKFKNIIYLIFGSVIPFIPILFFDIRHNFLNFKQFLEFVKGDGAAINRVLVVWDRASSFMVGGSPSKLMGLSVYFVTWFGFFVVAKKIKDKTLAKLFIGLEYVWASSIPLFYLLIKNPSEYYFNYLLVPAIILLAYLLASWKRVGLVVLGILMAYFAFRSLPLLRNVNLSLREKDAAVIFLSKVTEKSPPFDVSYDVPLNEDSGFRYLVNYHKIHPSENPRDPLIEFVIPHEKKPSAFVIGQIGIFIPENLLVKLQ